jgi:hypothetical protein
MEFGGNLQPGAGIQYIKSKLIYRFLYGTKIKKHYFLPTQIHFFDWHGIGQANNLKPGQKK